MSGFSGLWNHAWLRRRRPVAPSVTEASDQDGPAGIVPGDGPAVSRQDLGGVEDALRVEDGFELSVQSGADLAELPAEPLPLEDADAVLTGDGAAQGEPEGHDRLEGAHRVRLGRRVAALEDHRRMHVAVADVPAAGDQDVVV